MENTKVKLILVISILALGLGLVGCGKQPAVNQNVDVNTNVNSDEIDASGWQTYRNEEYGFEFKYPLYYQIDRTENDKIVFKSSKNGNDKIILTVYLGYKTEQEFISFRQDMINDNLFNYNFEKSSNNVYFLWNYNDALGLNNHSEMLVYNGNKHYCIGLLILTIHSDMASYNEVLLNISNSFKFSI